MNIPQVRMFGSTHLLSKRPPSGPGGEGSFRTSTLGPRAFQKPVSAADAMKIGKAAQGAAARSGRRLPTAADVRVA